MILPEWIEQAIEHPEKEAVQLDGRFAAGRGLKRWTDAHCVLYCCLTAKPCIMRFFDRSFKL